MAQADRIAALRDRVLADLIAAHDYYADAYSAWEIVHRVVAAGYRFTLHNRTTGTVTTQAALASRARGYMAGQLSEATFQQFIAIFENFFFDVLRLWLLAYPRSLIGRKVDFKDVLDAPDKDAIAQVVIDKELNELSYDRPEGWFTYLNDRVHLGCPSPHEIDRIAEAKATRDILVHNRGVANLINRAKAGRLARYQVGQRIDIPEQYHRETWELLRKVITDIANAAIARVL